MSKFRLACLASSAIFLASAPYVQAQETTASIHGTVTAGGAAAANTAVTILHTPSGTRQTTATNANGVFDSRGLRVGGPYTITVGDKAYENVFLELGKTLEFNADLSEQAAVEAVEVVATAANRDREQGPKTVLNRTAIEAVVSVNRDIRDLARGDILVSQDLSNGRTGANGGGISIAGSNPRFNRITVDGVSANDPFGLAQGGLTTARGPVTLDAVEQFVVAAVPTDVENGDFTGGAMNLVLRSGTNRFHGTAFVNYLNEGLVGTHLGQQTINQPITQKNYGGFLSGPIFKDKLFFAASYETYKTSDVTAFGTIGQGLANNLVNLTQAQFDAVVNTYNNNYASDFNIGTIEGTQPVTDKKYSGKIDWNITDRHRATLTYRFAKSTSIQRTDLGSSNNTIATPTSHWYQQLNQDEATTLEMHSNWSDKLSSTFKATYREYLNGQNPPSGQNYSDVAVCTSTQAAADSSPTACASGFTQVRWGPDQFRHANNLSAKELRFQGLVEYSLGANLIKLGGQARRANPYDLFVDQSRGVYYFDSLADFNAGRASRLQYKNATTGNAQDAAFDTTYWNYSLFLQDAVDLTDSLKFTAGARLDWYDYPDSPLLNPNFLARNGYTNQTTLDGRKVIQPRVSIEWKPTPNFRLAGGVGLFSGGTPDVLTGTPFYNTGYSISGVDIQRTATGFTEATGAPNFNNAIGSAALDNLNTDPKFGYAIPAQVQAFQRGTLGATQFIPTTGEVFALDPKFRLPSQWKVYLSGQWRVQDWTLGADLVASQAQNEITYYDSRAQPLRVNGVQLFLPDGRVRYDGLGAVPGKQSANLGANRDLIITNADKGDSWTIGFSLSRSWQWGGDFAVGYSRSNSNDLGPGLRFGTTAGSLYASVPAFMDPNNSEVGRSVDEIKDRFKIQAGYRHNFYKDNETRISLFGERQGGRPFGFSMQDTASGRSPVFGVNRTAQALYVPDMSGPGTGPAGLDYGIVTFATAGDRDLFKAYVARFGLPTGLVNKYSNTNRSINRLDLQVSQQFPSILPGHKFKVVFDVRNVLNLIDRNWGAVKEYSDVNTLTRVNCADAAGVAVPTTSAACPRYRYSSVPTSVTETTNNGLSLWYAQISLKYEF